MTITGHHCILQESTNQMESNSHNVEDIACPVCECHFNILPLCVGRMRSCYRRLEKPTVTRAGMGQSTSA